MLLRMLEEKMPVDIVVFVDTGLEFPQMYEHIDTLEQYTGLQFVRLKAPQTFEYLFYEYSPPRKNPALEGKVGLSWAGPQNRWCTARLKTRIIDRYVRDVRQDCEIVHHIGIAADEPKRIREKHYPLVEWGMTEADCLAYCKERGFTWGGLYDIFHRVSCWCCPLQSIGELRKLRKHFPELWQKLLYMDAHTWRNFRADYSAQQLEWRFNFEEAQIAAGLPIRGRAFHYALRDRLEKQAKAVTPNG